MQKIVIETTDAPKPIGPYSQAVWLGNTLFVSGQVAINPTTNEMYNGGDIKEETRAVMNNLQGILTAAGMDFSHVIKCSIFIADMNQFASINEVYGGYFTAPYPARETVEVRRLPKDAQIEISIIAAK